MKEYQEKNKDYIREQRRRHYLVNKESIKDRAKKWVKDNPEKYLAARERNKDKTKARNIVNRAIRRGKIKRLPCVNCGEKKSQAHHENYSKPLDVIWLCAPCHHAIHRGIVPLHKINPRPVYDGVGPKPRN